MHKSRNPRNDHEFNQDDSYTVELTLGENVLTYLITVSAPDHTNAWV